MTHVYSIAFIFRALKPVSLGREEKEKGGKKVFIHTDTEHLSLDAGKYV